MIIISPDRKKHVTFEKKNISTYIADNYFVDGIALAYLGSFGFIKTNGRFLEIEGNTVTTDILSNFPFGEVAYSEGFWRVRAGKSGKYGFLKPDGTYLKIEGYKTPRPFNEALNFKEGFACVKIGERYGSLTYGFINTNGKFLKFEGKDTPFAFESKFKDGLARVVTDFKNFNYFYINKFGMKFSDYPTSHFLNDYFLSKIGEEKITLFGYIYLEFIHDIR